MHLFRIRLDARQRKYVYVRLVVNQRPSHNFMIVVDCDKSQNDARELRFVVISRGIFYDWKYREDNR